MKCSQDAGYEAPHFGGRGVRIRAYWTKPIWSIPEVYRDSWKEIMFADQMLRGESLSLDVEPAFMELPPILPAPAPYLRPLERRVERRPPPPKRPLPSAFLDFNETLDLSNDQNLTEDFFRPLRSLVDRAPPKENRLIVVFTPLTSTVTFDGKLAESQGYTFLRSTTWLPWVLVDPREVDNDSLLHEIGHACRLAHRPNTIMGQGGAQAPILCDSQVHEIYKSYWCAGPRPRNWYMSRPMSHIGGPFLWDDGP
jgi:hypothetical protein